MKIQKILVILLAFSMMVPLVAIATAADYYPGLILGEPSLYTNNEMIWIVDIKHGFYGESAAFDGQLVISMAYEVRLVEGGDWIAITCNPTKVSQTDSMIKLWWNSTQLQDFKTDQGLGEDDMFYATRVTGIIEGGATFLATGPGFTSSFRPR